VPRRQDHIKRVITELGGKNADHRRRRTPTWTRPSHGVVASAFGYAGQKCSACSRAIVLAPVYDAFLSRLVEATRSLKVGPPRSPGRSRPGDRRRGAPRISQRSSAASGGEARYAGDVGALAERGCYVAPARLRRRAPDASLAQEEIFGPVLR
jgi:RHH-type proline utilization regulon transcriptional repressor/proline dehydrogenase/delta 1-pyrroline-5-carboxylate dehydrogenase